jgi:hypothetical protein
MLKKLKKRFLSFKLANYLSPPDNIVTRPPMMRNIAANQA